jgi:hypothetical protein
MSNATVLGATTIIAMDGPAKSRTESVLRWIWRAALVTLVLTIAGLAWLVIVARPYEAGSPLGYNLGLAGGLMMLSLLLYPLRKRVRWLDRLGRMESWFNYHMAGGIGGPLLILFHSTFRTGSMNARVALYAMLLVAASGVVGRFLYRHIHKGLYGRQLTLADVQAELQASSDNMVSVFALEPEIEARLRGFHDQAFARLDGMGARVWRFMSLRWQGRRLSREVRRQVRRALVRQGRARGRSRAELILNYRLAREQINRYIGAIVQAALLAGWERLFSLWHIVHLPFIYLLVLSGIVHVFAVHVY